MRGRCAALTVSALACGLGAGTWIARRGSAGAATRDESGPKVLYRVAPMAPNFRKDGPGKSPMGMDLIPVYEGDGPAGDPSEVWLSAAEVSIAISELICATCQRSEQDISIARRALRNFGVSARQIEAMAQADLPAQRIR